MPAIDIKPPVGGIFIGASVPEAPDTLKPNGNAIIKDRGCSRSPIFSVATGPFWGPFAINLDRCEPLEGNRGLRPLPLQTSPVAPY